MLTFRLDLVLDASSATFNVLEDGKLIHTSPLYIHPRHDSSIVHLKLESMRMAFNWMDTNGRSRNTDIRMYIMIKVY